jgi:two-component system NtrC family sensor kinase
VVPPLARLPGVVGPPDSPGRRAVADRERAEAALHDSERRYRLLAENVTDVIWTFSPRLDVKYVSPSVLRLRGYTVEEVLAQRPEERLAPSSLQLVRRVLAEEAKLERAGTADPGRVRTLELELPCKDGSTVWTEMRISAVRDSAGRVVELLGISRDITERRRAEQQVRLQAAALEAAANAILITDRSGVIQWVNAAFTRLTGYAPSEAVGQTPRLLRSGRQDAAVYRELWETIRAGRSWEGRLLNRHKDGTVYPERQTITPVKDADGEISHFIAIKQDLTQQERIEQELERQREALHQSDKLAALASLLAGVAHELNNPLAVVVGRACLLEAKFKDGPEAGQVEKLSEAAGRCARIVRNFLALARQYPPEYQQVELDQIVRDALELVAYHLRVDNVEATLDLAPDLPPLWADPHQLHQVLVNLMTNAHHAMRGLSPGRPRRLRLVSRIDPGRHRVFFEVADTGPGIPPETQSRIFEPFFTTKPPGQGTGLGLSLCQGIVESHGGAIRLRSQPGEGATFRVELPVRRSPAGEKGLRELSIAPSISGKAILVVDDEPDVAGVLADALRVDGHEVETAENGSAALEKLRGRTYDLIMSDLRMPELDGPGLYREVERRHPDLLARMVFLTGDTLGSESRDFLTRIGARSVAKPFLIEEVRRVVWEAFQTP